MLKSMLVGAAAGSAGLCSLEAEAKPNGLPRSLPEGVGVDPQGIIGFIEAVEKSVGGLHSFMLLRHGKVAAEGWWNPYAPQHPHMLYSLSKSFTSTAVGLAVADGKLTVNDKVTSFFPDSLPTKMDENLAAMQVRHLLTMSTGHDQDATQRTVSASDGNWVKQFLSLPVEHAPGSKFVYNSAATYMLSAIVQKLTGRKVADYLTPRLFEPIGITGQTWETCPRGINTGGWGLSVKTEDIARFGQLYLRKGEWNGKRLIPAAWVEEATSKQISNGNGGESDWAQGYGYQFWRCRYGNFRGDGAFGQYCLVMPQDDAVLAITSGIGNMQAVLDAAFTHIRPAMQSTTSHKSREIGLSDRLSQLAIAPPTGIAEPPATGKFIGKVFRLDSNPEGIESFRLDTHPDRFEITFKGKAGERKVACGTSSWIKGTDPFAGGATPISVGGNRKAACRAAWTDENTLTAKLCFYETPYIQTMTCRFENDKLTITRKMNVNFGPTESPTLTGRMV